MRAATRAHDARVPPRTSQRRARPVVRRSPSRQGSDAEVRARGRHDRAGARGPASRRRRRRREGYSSEPWGFSGRLPHASKRALNRRILEQSWGLILAQLTSPRATPGGSRAASAASTSSEPSPKSVLPNVRPSRRRARPSSTSSARRAAPYSMLQGRMGRQGVAAGEPGATRRGPVRTAERAPRRSATGCTAARTAGCYWTATSTRRGTSSHAPSRDCRATGT